MALANSINIPAVKLTQKLGVDKVVKLAKKMGITPGETQNNMVFP